MLNSFFVTCCVLLLSLCSDGDHIHAQDQGPPEEDIGQHHLAHQNIPEDLHHQGIGQDQEVDLLNPKETTNLTVDLEADHPKNLVLEGDPLHLEHQFHQENPLLQGDHYLQLQKTMVNSGRTRVTLK